MVKIPKGIHPNGDILTHEKETQSPYKSVLEKGALQKVPQVSKVLQQNYS